MTKAPKLPEFTVDADPVLVNVLVKWQDAARRYHVWINDAGELRDETLHSNPIVPSKRYRLNEHRALDATSKKWAPLVEAILARVKADDLVAKARAASKEKAQREAEDRQRAINESRLANLAAACVHFPNEITAAIAALPESDRLAFVVSLEPRL
jgi:hypothetical protein